MRVSKDKSVLCRENLNSRLRGSLPFMLLSWIDVVSYTDLSHTSPLFLTQAQVTATNMTEQDKVKEVGCMYVKCLSCLLISGISNLNPCLHVSEDRLVAL